MALTLTSTAFGHGDPIPVRHTADGGDFSPPLNWTAPPDGTAAFALICDDPDAPAGTWVHWVLVDIPADTRALAENIPEEREVPGVGIQGRNDFGHIGYGGPAPPPGPRHRYYLKLYALDQPTGLSSRATKAQVLQAIDGHVLAECQLMGTYQR